AVHYVGEQLVVLVEERVQTDPLEVDGAVGERADLAGEETVEKGVRESGERAAVDVRSEVAVGVVRGAGPAAGRGLSPPSAVSTAASVPVILPIVSVAAGTERVVVASIAFWNAPAVLETTS